MKKLKYILVFSMMAIFALSCNDGIDDLTQVAPGVDLTAPIIKVVYPTDGTAIKVFEEVTSVNIEFEVTDDIEIIEIAVLLDGTEIAEFNDFLDYRRALKSLTYDGLKDGNHKLTIVATDIEGKTTTEESDFSKEPAYSPLFDGELLYMPFDGDYINLIGFNFAEKYGTPGFSGSGYAGTNSFRGATDSYITLPTEGLLNEEFSATFWYKVDANPDRAGILVIGADDNRTQGLRLFREGSSDEQRIKLNIGTGADESWNDGGVIDVTAGEWIHIAFTISATKSTIYFNGIEQLSVELDAPIDWTGCESMTIGSGAPTFSYWDHKSDNSDLDELRIFNKELSQSEIQIMINAFNPYFSLYDGESFYMPFDGNYINLVGSSIASEVGSPSITADSQSGSGAYLGANDAYLTHPSDGLTSNQFSAAFWYKVDATPDRAGILTAGNDIPENRNQGFRLFREGSDTEQRIKLNVGTGTSDSWNDGGVIDVTAGEWVHIAFTISDTNSVIYLNGVEVNTADLSAPIDWTGVESFTIGSGVPTFSYWDHLSDNSAIDELRFFNKGLSAEEVVAVYGGEMPTGYGETFYVPFNGSYVEKVNNLMVTEVGTPSFAGESVQGSDAYAGADESYLTFPTTGLLTPEFSATMWYKLNADPDRAGILTMGPEDVDNDSYPDVQNKRTSGFRFFREDADGKQRFKLNVGDGTADIWVDGGTSADVDPTTGNWIHLAFTISGTDAIVYIDGVQVAQSTIDGIDWTGCDILSVMSGAPRFNEWGHFSDNSYLDELRLFEKVLTQEEIQTIIDNEL